ncbi:IPT/TIG domain-containing protein [Aminobacter sp. LjRoot7]|uniref:IPT/TIG domain-containing protein n=1 Tax=Aminobacter sp. LjRoot7 TaxID=3342335 RepID=UPI003ECF3932
MPYGAVNFTYIQSATVNSADLYACDTNYPGVDSGLTPKPQPLVGLGATTQGGTFKAVENALDNTVTYSAPPGFAGTDTFTLRYCDLPGCSGLRIATVTVTVLSNAPTVTSISPTSGPTAGGTPVVITGTNFTGATAVTFGASVATGFTVDSATQITATSPAGTGTVDVTVTTPEGTSATSAADQFTYVAAPTVTSITPTAGPTSGGTTVIITGTNFSAASAVNFGGTAATGFAINSATQITATSPAGTGTVDVTVTSPGGTSATTAADQFTYVAAPTVTSISPTAGPAGGGTSVTITGTNLSGATAVTFGGAAAAGYSVNSTTQITATSPAGSGTVDVRVTTAGGTSAISAADQFTYVATPIVTYVSPWFGPTAGGTTVAISGTNLSGATSVTFGAVSASFTVISATQIAATSPAGAAGTVDITVTTPGGTSATSASDQFTYVAPPTVTALSANRGSTAGGGSVTLTGTGFTHATDVTFGGATAGFIAIDDTNIVVFSLPAHSAGLVNVVVTSPGGASAAAAANEFTYIAPPTVTAVSPTSGPTAGGTSVILTGTGFTGATDVNLGAAAATFDVNSDTQITATSPAGSAGTVDITVRTVGGTSATSAADQFTYVAPPTVTSITPTSGPASGGTFITITGTGFTGATAVSFGGTAATSFTFISPTQITATSPAGSGTVDVRVTAVGGTSAVSAADQFTYIPAPTVTSISPTSGPTAGGTTVVITGTGFSGASAVTFGATAATGYTVNSATQITATSPAGTGTIDVRVTTGGGTSATSAADQFTYIGAPVVTSVSPTSGPTSGGTTVTITGTGFTTASAVTFGATPAAGYTINSATQITATSPAASAGTVDVTVATVGGTSATSAADQFTYVAPPTAGNVSATVAHRSTNNPITLALGGTPATSVAVATQATNGTATATGTTITYTPTAGYAGPDSFTYTATNVGGTSSPATVTITVSPPTIMVGPLTVTLPVYATAYSQLITASGGQAPYGFAVTSGALPAGLTLAADGTLSGTPTVIGNFNFKVTATDQSTGPAAPFTDSRTYNVTIAAPTLTLSPAAGALPGATAGSAYSQTFSANGGVGPFSYAITAGSLPNGVTLDPSTGVLAGTPTAAGTFNVTVTATDAGSFTVANPYSLTVAVPTLTIGGTLSDGVVGQTYSQTLTASGGVAPYSITLQSGTLPAGLTLSAGGTLSGTPTQGGSFNLVIRATDSSTGSGPAIVDRNFTLVINAPTITVTPTTLPNPTVGIAYTQSLSASGGTAPHSFTVTSGAMPAGMTLSTGGVLAGTPTANGSFSFTVTATDASTGTGPFTGSQAYTIEVEIPRVTFVIQSPANGSFTFSSPEPSLNFTINASGGGGTSGPLNVPAGSHAITFTIPAGFALASASCSDPQSSLNPATLSGTIALQSGSDMTCTIVAGDTQPTTELIGAFLEARSELIIANQPDSGRRLARLTGASPGVGGVSGFGLGFTDPRMPLALRFGSDEASFAYSLERSRSTSDGAPTMTLPASAPGDDLQRDDLSVGPAPDSLPMMHLGDPDTGKRAKPTPFETLGVAPEAEGDADPQATPFDFWVEGKLARFNAYGADGRFGILHAGADYLVTPRILVGLGLQLDWTDMEADDGATIEGTGYLVGPYVTARLTENLFLDARAAWGQSSNTASPFGTYEDDLDGTRWLVSAALIGQYDIDRWRVAPTARLTYFEEGTDAYTDGLGLPIPEIEIATGTFEFGPKVSYRMELDSGMSFEPFMSLEGIWTFEQKNTGTSATSSPGLADTGLRGRGEVGFSLSGGPVGSWSASAFYDGVGDDDFESWGGRLRFNKSF